MAFLDYAGTAAFAIGGTISAGRAGMDLIGCLWLGLITAVGGGTIRDALLFGRAAFWASDPSYLYLSLLASAAVFASRHRALHSSVAPAGRRALGWALEGADALGLGAFAVIGAQAAQREGLGPALALISGLLSATGAAR